jgi:hypothetical protein
MGRGDNPMYPLSRRSGIRLEGDGSVDHAGPHDGKTGIRSGGRQGVAGSGYGGEPGKGNWLRAPSACFMEKPSLRAE